MKIIAILTLLLFSLSVSIAFPAETTRKFKGAALFRKHCFACHPNLRKMQRENIVGRMRNPLPPMPAFNKDKISDNDAKAIADFIRDNLSNENLLSQAH